MVYKWLVTIVPLASAGICCNYTNLALKSTHKNANTYKPQIALVHSALFKDSRKHSLTSHLKILSSEDFVCILV